MAYRGGYKGLAASLRKKAKEEATKGLYEVLGGKSTDKRIARKNPTTRNVVNAWKKRG